MSKYKYIVEVCPKEPRADICGPRGGSVAKHSDVLDCTRSGDCEPACRYLLSLGVDFRIVAKNANGEYVNRKATDQEIIDTARAIYFESESDLADLELAKVYLLWSATDSARNEDQE